MRYKWGNLTVLLSDSGGSINDAIENGKRLIDLGVGDEFDGVMSYYELWKHTKDKISWPTM